MPSREINECNRQTMERFIRDLATKGRELEALGMAATLGRIELIEEFFAKGFTTETRDGYGNTPLIHAASGGATKAVEYLLERGADVNAAGYKGMTPLLACLAGLPRKQSQIAVCKLLLKAGASCDVRDIEFGRTPLEWAEDGRPAEIVALIEEYVRA